MALKALSQNGVTGALVRAMEFAQRYTAAVDFADLERARLILDRTHAFTDPAVARWRSVASAKSDAAWLRFEDAPADEILVLGLTQGKE